MAAGEIAAAVTSIRAAYDLTKAMIALRDADLFAEKSRELNALMLDVLDKSISAREAQATQLDEISALKAEIADLKAWNAEKQRYELKAVGAGATVYVLKPDERSGKPPHWLCPDCFEQSKKAFMQNTNKVERARLIARCNTCNLSIPVGMDISKWPE